MTFRRLLPIIIVVAIVAGIGAIFLNLSDGYEAESGELVKTFLVGQCTINIEKNTLSILKYSNCPFWSTSSTGKHKDFAT